MRHFLSLADTSTTDLNHIFDVAIELRAQRSRGQPNPPMLAGKTLAMIFEKPSLRTRVSFEEAMYELGGQTIVMSDAEVGLGKREPPADVARVLSGMVHGIMARVFQHQKLLDLAAASAIPVINALSDYSHPCQSLADALTIFDEFGRNPAGRTMAFIGDGNNVARSTAVLCHRLGMNFILACPKGYELDMVAGDAAPSVEVGDGVQRIKVDVTHDPRAAVTRADIIYTDTWVSMGQESEAPRRKASFAPYQVNAALLAAAPRHAIVLHCLPAYRGAEISADVLEGPHCRAFPQSHNRLHAQKGLLAVLMGKH